MDTVSEVSEAWTEPQPEVIHSNSRTQLEAKSLNTKETEKETGKETGTAFKRGMFNKSKPTVSPLKPAPSPPVRNDSRAYLSFLFTLNQFAWDIVLFKNHMRTILIVGAVVFSIIITFYPLFHCLVLILLLGFAVSIVYSLVLLLFRIIVGKPATHPFRHLLSQTESQIDPALFESWTRSILEVFGPLLNLLLRLVLFYDLRLSIAFSLLLYVTSYVTIYITFPYILTAVLVTSFIAPKAYSLSQESVDALIGKLMDKYRKVAARIERVVETE